jgi:hypothetical protein
MISSAGEIQTLDVEDSKRKLCHSGSLSEKIFYFTLVSVGIECL